jgi:predicted phage gp36 major capsid-like protein
MSSEPSYPRDASVGDAKLNETLSHAVTAKQAEERAAEAGDKPKGSARSFVRGAAVGVGSAALVAALLYANRSRFSGSDKSEDKSSDKRQDEGPEKSRDKS